MASTPSPPLTPPPPPFSPRGQADFLSFCINTMEPRIDFPIQVFPQSDQAARRLGTRAFDALCHVRVLRRFYSNTFAGSPEDHAQLSDETRAYDAKLARWETDLETIFELTKNYDDLKYRYEMLETQHLILKGDLLVMQATVNGHYRPNGRA
ncbi:hypothetical protein EXIGLDRAFT_781652 [Exidia glandulosa HHB12029]|uniref:Uncharacterized protein n=1 Tax=Exidia glandulosa HHB12029 TaxID=1314781 RepID=A0A165B6H8_EXIGL|nr:hypothetical protein EXIGLDRAFT_781652 [Exidia glandulosa HHB12029]